MGFLRNIGVLMVQRGKSPLEYGFVEHGAFSGVSAKFAIDCWCGARKENIFRPA